MKTLSDLKRDLSIGRSLTLIKSETMPDHKFLNLKRYIVKKNTVGIVLNEDKNAIKGSQMDFPKKATLLEYDDNIITLYQAGERKLMEREKEVLANRPSKRTEYKEQVEIDIMTDGSSMFWKDKGYFKELDMEYLEGHEWKRGLRYNSNTQMITDETIKGQIDLQYQLN